MKLTLQLCERAQGICVCKHQVLSSDAVRVRTPDDGKPLVLNPAAVQKFKESLRKAGWTVQSSGVAAVQPGTPPRLVHERACPLHGHLVPADLPNGWFVIREPGR